MKKFIVLLAVFAGSLAQAAPYLKVYQGFTTPYWAEFVADGHTAQAFKFLDTELRKFDCIQGESDVKVLVKAKNKIFGKDIPGKLLLTYKTKCYAQSLASVRFYISSIGYDEDYTQVVLEVGNKKGDKLYKEICVYGLDDETRKCPRGFPKPETWSTEINQEQMRLLRARKRP